MYFRFIGSDAPDWLLAELALLSKMSSVRLKLLCAQIAIRILKGEIDYEKALKHTESSNFSTSDVKAGVAAIHFILNNSAKFEVDDGVLASELMQLGLPKEHADGIARVYRDNRDALVDKLKNETLRLNSIQNVDWRVDQVLGSSYIKDIQQPTLHLSLQTKSNYVDSAIDGKSNSDSNIVAFELSADKFRVLLSDLYEAKKIMDASAE